MDQISVRVTADELAYIDSVAASLDCSRTEAVRYMIDMYRRRK
jgi:hypothetical protein